MAELADAADVTKARLDIADLQFLECTTGSVDRCGFMLPNIFWTKMKNLRSSSSMVGALIGAGVAVALIVGTLAISHAASPSKPPWSPGDLLTASDLNAVTMQHVGARYTTSSTVTLSGQTTVIDFSTKTYDPAGVVTTGQAWSFTAPFAGRYSVSVNLLIVTSHTNFADAMLVNSSGTTLSQSANPVIDGTYYNLRLNDVVSLNAGDGIHFATNAVGQIYGNTVYNWIAIERVSP
jgi:hypothetical protein